MGIEAVEYRCREVKAERRVQELIENHEFFIQMGVPSHIASDLNEELINAFIKIDELEELLADKEEELEELRAEHEELQTLLPVQPKRTAT